MNIFIYLHCFANPIGRMKYIYIAAHACPTIRAMNILKNIFRNHKRNNF